MYIIKAIKSVNVCRKAMAVPLPTGETAKKMKEQGIYVLQDMLNRMPHTNIKDMQNKIQEVVSSGASEFFRTLDPKAVIQLPEIYVASPKDVFELDGKKYFAIEISPPKVVGKKWKSLSGREYSKGEQYDGEVLAIDIDSGLPVPLPFPLVRDKITAPTGDKQETLDKLNTEIAAYNERIRTINKAVGASKISLQINRASQMVDERLETLDAIRKATESKIQRYEKAPLEAYEEWAKFLRESIKDGTLNIRDVYDTLLFLYQSNPEKLIEGIDNGKIRIPDELKDGIKAIAFQEAKGITQHKKEKEQEDLEREERIRAREIPEIHDEEIKPFQLGDIPSEEYKKVRGDKTLYHWLGSHKRSLAGTNRDIAELTAVKTAMEDMKKYMGDLEKGQRSKAFLSSPEGKAVVESMSNFLNQSSMFIKRYATNVIQDGKVNPQLMGSSGTVGNALIAVSLTRLYNIIDRTIKDIPISTTKQEKGKPVTPVDAPKTPIASSESKIQKMSRLLWKAFEDRMRLK